GAGRRGGRRGSWGSWDLLSTRRYNLKYASSQGTARRGDAHRRAGAAERPRDLRHPLLRAPGPPTTRGAPLGPARIRRARADPADGGPARAGRRLHADRDPRAGVGLSSRALAAAGREEAGGAARGGGAPRPDEAPARASARVPLLRPRG